MAVSTLSGSEGGDPEPRARARSAGVTAVFHKRWGVGCVCQPLLRKRRAISLVAQTRRFSDLGPTRTLKSGNIG